MTISSPDIKTGVVERIKPGSREFYQFLLGDSANSQELSLDDLPRELELMASGENLTDEARLEEIKDLKEGCRSLAQELSEQHELGDNDSIALEDVLVGLSQANFLDGQESYDTAIFHSEQTGYLDGTQHGRERLNASPQLFDIIVKQVLDRVVLLENGVQLRASSNPLFRRSAARVNTIIDKISKSPLDYSPKFIEVSPLHKISEDYSEWVNYRNEVQTT
ncbi:hypothetical protein KC726_01520 [Candidatus Woesebacteria bacterium]|nr:hypothetical protein [Candidatus Woesebacteria bacterium]